MLSPPAEELSCVNSSCVKPGLIWALEGGTTVEGGSEAAAVGGLGQHNPGSNTGTDVLGFCSWKRHFKQKCYKLESIQMGTGERSGKNVV